MDTSEVKDDLKGLVVPVLTPFLPSGAVDSDTYIRHLNWLTGQGVHRIMVNGTTGEFYALTSAERKALLTLARTHFSGYIIAHAGGVGLAENRVEIETASELGADAVAVLPPIYPSGLSAEGVIAYLCALEEAARLPFILYNFAQHTGNPLTPEILRAVPHAALKDSSKNWELMEATPKYFAGSSSTIFEPVRQGAAGFVSAVANVRPDLYSALEMLLEGPRSEEALLLQQEIRAFSQRFSAGGAPHLKKALAQILPGGYPLHCRAPF